MQDRKNGGERMEAVLLGLTPEVRVSDRQSPLAGALRRELAAVTGLAVTALDLDPRDESLFDTLADALEECQVLVTVGDLETPGGLRRLLTRGLGLETLAAIPMRWKMPRPGAGSHRTPALPPRTGGGAGDRRGIPHRRRVRLRTAEPAAGDSLPAR